MWRPRLLTAMFLAAALACSGGGSGGADAGDGGTSLKTDGGADAGLDAGTDGGVDPTLDSDGDGLKDVVEDANHNGRVDPGETDPQKIDSDCDGLIDGPDQPANGFKGEDQNANGKVDTGETDPRKLDSDADGLTDGVELGVATAPDATCTGFVADGDPTTTTDATNPDSDGDGIMDGTEDSNHDGNQDPGETNAGDGSDATTPAGEACAADKLRPVAFAGSHGGHLRVGLPGNFTEVLPLGGAAQGLAGYDAADQVAFFTFVIAPPAADVSADEAALRSQLAGVGGLSLPSTQTFTTWDGFPGVRGLYTQAGGVDLKARANALAEALAGTGAGTLTGTAGVNGPFQLEVEYVHRSANELAVVVALAPASRYGTEATFFSVGDTAGGSALANFTDGDQVQCESFTTHPAKVDFLFVVDDSSSMGPHQQQLADAADAVAARLNNAYLDWRIALVTSDYHFGTKVNHGVIRGFTTDIEQVKSWLTQNSTCSSTTGPGTCSLPATHPACGGTTASGANGGCWIGTGGSGNESVLGAARKAVDDLTPASATEVAGKVREGAQVVVVLLGDADDQTKDYFSASACGGGVNNGCAVEDVQDFIKYFTNDPAGTDVDHTKNPLDANVSVNGILFPLGGTCGGSTGIYCEYQHDPQRHAAVIAATGGVLGDIQTTAGVETGINQIVDNAINSAGHTLTKAPIGASIKVVLDGVEDTNVCPKADPADLFFSVPRSRTDGFDFDGVTGKLSFFGACRPAVPDVTEAAVSYRYWNQSTACPADCGGCPENFFCNQEQCACITIN